MWDVLGLLGMFVFCAFVISLAAAVTWVVVQVLTREEAELSN